MRQTTAEYYRAADAEGNEMQTTAMYDTNRVFHRQELPVPVRELSKFLSGSCLNADSNTTSCSNNPNSLRKRECCRTSKRTGVCKFGESCRFDHAASADTPAPAANLPANTPCRTFKSTGVCKFGEFCRFDNAASADTPAAAANLPAAVAMQDPEEDQMGIDLEEFACGAGLGPGCAKTYKTCPLFWVKLGKKHKKAFVNPNSCRYCRKIKRENRNNHRNANMKADSDDSPVARVAVLVMAAVGPRNTSQPVDGQNWFVDRLRLAVDTDLLSVDTLDVPRAQSQLLSANIGTSSNIHNCDNSSNLRQCWSSPPGAVSRLGQQAVHTQSFRFGPLWSGPSYQMRIRSWAP